MPEFKSKSESSVRRFSLRAMAELVLSAMVDVPTPALDGRNVKIRLVVSYLGGVRSSSFLTLWSASITEWRSNGAVKKSRIRTRLPSPREAATQGLAHA